MTRRVSIFLTCTFLVLAFCQPAFAKKRRARTAQASTSAAINKTIQDFWTALGAFDAEAMKQTLGWPVTFVEASVNETTTPRSVASPSEFDELLRSAHRPASGKSEFAGAKLSAPKVQMLGNTLALVTYTAKLAKETAEQKAGDFNLVAILRKDLSANVWKIIFITVPK